MQNVQNDVQNRVPINNVERTQDKDRIKIAEPSFYNKLVKPALGMIIQCRLF